MQTITQQQLEIGLVRCAERWPDRVGLTGRFNVHDCSDHCILGQIIHDLGLCCKVDHFYFVYGTTDEALISDNCLAYRAATLNNQGVPWGHFPKLLGLVPGKQPTTTPLLANTDPSLSTKQPAELVLQEVL